MGWLHVIKSTVHMRLSFHANKGNVPNKECHPGDGELERDLSRKLRILAYTKPKHTGGSNPKAKLVEYAHRT